MRELLPFIGTALASILGSGLLLAIVQRRWTKRDESAARKAVSDAAGAQAVLADGAQIRHELWIELGSVRGELKAVQAQQVSGLEERFQLKMSIKGLEKAEEECRQELTELKRRVTVTETVQQLSD